MTTDTASFSGKIGSGSIRATITSVMQSLLTRTGTRVDGWLRSGKPVREVVEEMFWSALSRAPTAIELERGEEYLATAKDRRKGAEDVLWALLNSKEFLFRQ